VTLACVGCGGGGGVGWVAGATLRLRLYVNELLSIDMLKGCAHLGCPQSAVAVGFRPAFQFSGHLLSALRIGCIAPRPRHVPLLLLPSNNEDL
jgi:hypothetical protein